MMPDPHHARLLLAIVGERWDEAASLATSPPTSGAAFVAQCRECDVHPWVYHLLQGREGLVDDQARSRLVEMRRKVRQDNLLLLARAEEALDVLAGVGVTPVALKGLDFVHRLYAFDQRTMDDVDLLVRDEDLQRSLAALQAAGWQLPPESQSLHYIRSSHHLQLRAPGPIDVFMEIHWNLAQRGRYAIDPRALFERAHPLDVAGREVLRLDGHDIVAHLLIHHFSHYFDRRLKWVVDLQQLGRRDPIDWERVARRIRSWHGTAAAAISLVHLKKLAPELIPESALRRLPVAVWRRALTLPLRSAHPLELFRGTRARRVQLYLAAVMLEHPSRLPGWLLHRSTRDRGPTDHPLDRDRWTAPASTSGQTRDERRTPEGETRGGPL